MLIGQEYTVIGWCNNRSILGDKILLKGLLHDICHHISMQPLDSISVNVPVELKKLDKEQFEDEGGATASLILSTSHASIHGWPERDNERKDGGFFWFTVGSCRSFDSDIVDRILGTMLQVTKADRLSRWISIINGEFFHSTERPL
jgi:S-adenosylmethionine/arginine decarboxylase-like enzyme